MSGGTGQAGLGRSKWMRDWYRVRRAERGDFEGKGVRRVPSVADSPKQNPKESAALAAWRFEKRFPVRANMSA